MDEFKKKRLDFKVFYFRSIDRGMPAIKERDYLDVRLNFKDWHRFFFKFKENKVLKDFEKLYNIDEFNLLHAHTLFSNGYIAYKLNKKYNIPYVVSVRDMDLNLFFKYRINLRKLGIEIIKNAESIVFISSNYKEQLIANYIPDNLKNEIMAKSVVIPNGINDFYHSNSLPNSKILDNKIIKIITVGYISQRKNQLLVARALNRLCDEGYTIQYKIVGKVLDEDIYAQLMKYDFIEYIPFLPKEDLINLYRESNIFVMPSITETFGLTYVEAMTQGLPVIYSRNQGFDGYFRDGKVGYAVENNLEDLIDKIKLVILNYNELSSNAYDESSYFNWSEVVDEYLNLYTHQLGKG